MYTVSILINADYLLNAPLQLTPPRHTEICIKEDKMPKDNVSYIKCEHLFELFAYFVFLRL
jgi:hypothetical protein